MDFNSLVVLLTKKLRLFRIDFASVVAKVLR